MPTYDYRCQSCGSRFEVWQKITDEPVETCPTCGGPVRRVLYPVGLVFKGSGFYKTDNRDSSSASVASSESTSNSAAAESKTSTEPAKTSTESAKPAAEPAKSTATVTASE